MMATRKVRMGRPPKEPKDRHDKSIYVRANDALKDAIVQYQHDHSLISESEAVRQLVIAALRAEGRM